MRVQPPSTLHFPLTIKRIDKTVGEAVKQRDSLFTYSYVETVRRQKSRYDDEEEEVATEMFAAFESPIEGTISKWLVWEGDVMRHPGDALEIDEECEHSVVFNGLCAACGRDMTGVDVVEHATVQAAHDTDKLLISEEEAAEADLSSKKHLLTTRKLSLVVDLDQTIIHAAVDPTIGEWRRDPDNPNFEALKDVHAFQLAEDASRERGCWYYIKPRPGLQQFLESIAEKYELHVYTMGTRQYAEQIANMVDPHRKYFGERILSRDESGSMTAKSLTRIFPVDTRMVVIIDDRADVWKWSPNLLRVSAFDFFVGIGDINASPTPQKENSEGQNGHDTADGRRAQVNGAILEETTTLPTDTTVLQRVMEMSSQDTVGENMAKTQEREIASQLEDKPLLKLQQRIDEKDAVDQPNSEPTATQGTESESDSDSSNTARAKRHAILKDDDEELVHLERSLRTLHDRFYSDYDRRRGSGKGGRIAALAGKQKPPVPESDESALQNLPDVKKILPSMKERVLDGVVIVFSGVLALGTRVQDADISIWARTFGARIDEKVTKEVTHVIAARVGTAKVKTAVKRGIKVVSTDWLRHSIQRWKKLDERPYMVKDIGQKELEKLPSSPAAPREPDLREETRLGTPGDILLSSEEDTPGINDTDDNDDGPKRKRQKLSIEADRPRGPDQEIEAVSPVDLNIDDWADMNDDLRDALGSDWESESDAESVRSDRSTLSSRPKKRSRDKDDDGESDRGSDSDGDNRTGDYKRMKPSRTSGSGLKAVSNAESNGSTPAKSPDQQEEDDLTAALDAELDAALAEEEAAALAGQ